MVKVALWVSPLGEVIREVKPAVPVSAPAVTMKVQRERVTVILASIPEASPQVSMAVPSEAYREASTTMFLPVLTAKVAGGLKMISERASWSALRLSDVKVRGST